MAKADIRSIMYSQNKSPLEFNFETLSAPPLLSLLTIEDIQELHRIASSIKLSSKIEQKYKMIDDIMVRRGFKKLGCGTNRVVYSFLEDQSFVIKIALDRVGLGDNPAEYINQHLLKPFCTKIFEVSPCGTVALTERVQPITSRQEFASIAGDYFELINNYIIGEYVLEDFGNNYFMNVGLRERGFGIVILDFPYVYPLDGGKLFCDKPHEITGEPCGGTIDYDDGFNNLVCSKCGKRYLAIELRKNENSNIKICNKGDDLNMKVLLCKGDKILKSSENATETIVKPEQKIEVQTENLPANVKKKVKTTIGTVMLCTTKKKTNIFKPRKQTIEEVQREREQMRAEYQASLKVNAELENVENPEMVEKFEKALEEKKENPDDFIEKISKEIEERNAEVEEDSVKEETGNIVLDNQVRIEDVVKNNTEEDFEEEEIYSEEEIDTLDENNNDEEDVENLDENIDREEDVNNINYGISQNAKEMMEKFGLSEKDFEEPKEEEDEIEQKYGHLEDEVGEVKHERMKPNPKSMY